MILHRSRTRTKQQQVNQSASQTAAAVSSQIAEPVLHVARWAMLVALAALFLAVIGLGLSLWLSFR